jgi:CheY-like chemotaxis protein
MKRVGRVLVLDDDPEWQNILTRLLTGAGYRVDTADSREKARLFLHDSFYHLAIFDMSLVANEANNTEGLQLLGELNEEGHQGGMEIMMISAYGTKEHLREAFKQYRVADFQDKYEFDETAFGEQVRKILAASVNLDLDLHWELRGQPEHVVLNLEISGERVKRDTPLQLRIFEELDDLLCRLFHRAQSLLVRPLTAGMSGSGVLRATPFYNAGAAQPVVVKFGSSANIRRENENFKEHTQRFIGGRSTTVIDTRYTTHLGGIIYSLLGSMGDKIESFSNFYSNADISQIKETLTRLFDETCGAWYANPGLLQLRDLTNEYRELLGFTDENLTQAFSHLKGVQGKRQLYFETLGTRPFTNPIVVSAERQFKRPTYVCITHGDLNGENILVDDSGHPWLIDFECTGRGHVLRDIAELDTVVRFQLLQAEQASLSERLQMEEMLSSAKHLSDINHMADRFQPTNAALAKSYATSVCLRMIACKMMSKNPNADLDEYHIALFYYSMNAIRFLSWRGIQRQHALLSASLLADQLGL